MYQSASQLSFVLGFFKSNFKNVYNEFYFDGPSLIPEVE